MSGLLPFTKMHGAGNDYVVLDDIRDDLAQRPLEAGPFDISDRHFGMSASIRC